MTAQAKEVLCQDAKGVGSESKLELSTTRLEQQPNHIEPQTQGIFQTLRDLLRVRYTFGI